MADLAADYVALRREAGAAWLDRDALLVEGPDAESFLQGQLAQDVARLSPGGAAWSWLLQPQGKVDALVRVVRTSPEAFVLDTDAGWGGHVEARLNRFKLRVKADLAPVEGWRCLTVRGPKAGSPPAAGGALVDPVGWPGLPGYDLLGGGVTGPVPSVPEGARLCDAAAWEAVRVEAGVPRMGAELTDATIPAEAGQWLIDLTVSFTKGCFTGQELVARIDSRGGNVPRHLRGVLVATNVVPPVGAEVRAGGKVVGRLTSVAESLDRRAPVALAYIARATEPPADVTLAWEGAEVPARVETLPLAG